MGRLLSESFIVRYKDIAKNGSTYTIKNFLENNPHVDCLHLLHHDLNIFRALNNQTVISLPVVVEKMKQLTIGTVYVLTKEKKIETEIENVIKVEKEEIYKESNIDSYLLELCRYFEKKSKKKFVVEDRNKSKRPIVSILSFIFK